MAGTQQTGTAMQFPGFKDNHFDDIFLSNPAGSDEQLIPIDAHNLYGTSTRAIPSSNLRSPENQPFAGAQTEPGSYTPLHPSVMSSPFLSPEIVHQQGPSDYGSYSSPVADSEPAKAEPSNPTSDYSYLEQLYINTEAYDPPSPREVKPTQHSNTNLPSKNYLGTGQLLSPVLTNTPSPSASHPQLGELPTHDHHDPTHSPTSIPDERLRGLPALQLPPAATAASEIEGLARIDPSNSAVDTPAPKEHHSLKKAKRKNMGSTDHTPRASDETDDAVDPSQDPAASGATRAADGSWIRNPTTGHGGLDPSLRTSEYVPNFKEMEAQRALDEKNADVERWLSVNEVQDQPDDGKFSFPQQIKKSWPRFGRARAKSTGDSPLGPHNTQTQYYNDAIPGPGVLVEEESGEEEEDTLTTCSSRPRSPLHLESSHQDSEEDRFRPSMDSISLANEEPLPQQFIRARPWKDPLRNQQFGATKEQPPTSSAAIFRFLRQADNTDNASRRATWGTRDIDVESLRFEDMHIGDEGMKERFRRIGLFGSKLIPKRAHSNAKRKNGISQQVQPSVESLELGKSISGSSILPQRKPSAAARAKPLPNTGVSLLGMPKQPSAIGPNMSVEPQNNKSHGAWSHLMKRNRGVPETPKGFRSPNAAGQPQPIVVSGSPLAPTLVSPLRDSFSASASAIPATKSPANGNDTDENDHNNEDEDEEVGADKGIFMDFSIRADLIVPTVEGFRAHVEQLNPRLQPALVERIANEQLRRYKKLVELKMKHIQAVNRGTCPSREHCFAQGGEATVLQAKTSPKDTEMTYGQPQGAGNDDANGASADNAITDSMFPSGVPLPPVKRLPAKFECSLCFEVKKFQKPSDWTKHVHEDIQPFTCTFPDCPEPKSFKRKADWVRHENERHRHLEWWECNMLDCSHKCYRKDNFVQHLVREHKMPEPRINRGRGRGQAENPVAHTTDDDTTTQDAEKSVWDLVESCRHVTTKQPTEEACRFCGNVCNSWKKLTVHMAKHMEQIAMPVLQLVEQRTSTSSAVTPIDDLPIPSAQGSMAAPFEGYSNQVSGQSRLGPPPSRGKSRSSNQAIGYGGTASLLPMAFSVQEPKVKKVPMQTPMSGAKPQYSMLPTGYAMHPPFSQGNSPILRGDGHQYTAVPQQPFAVPNTYPSPFNAPPQPPRHAGGEMPYNLDMTGVSGGQMYASPVENYPYNGSPTGMYAQGHHQYGNR